MWQAGDQVVMRFTWSGDFAWITPVTVVEDSPELIALYVAMDTPIKRPVLMDGQPVPRHQAYEPRQRVPWRLGDARWQETSVLWLARPGAAHAIGLFWQEPERTFLGWYGNLQAPLVRTSIGFDSTDHALDVQIAPDRTWHWKDEDEFADILQRRLLTHAAAQAIRAEGEQIIRDAKASAWPFNAGWETWQPDPGWPIPTLPEGWETKELPMADTGSRHPIAFVTGGSRGVGEATALALAHRGYDVAIGYRNKAARAEGVAEQIRVIGRRALTVGGDLTHEADRAAVLEAIWRWSGALDVLVLNASGGLERDLVEANQAYPLLVNRDAQLALLEAVQPVLKPESTVVFVTSHWAHRYGEVSQLPDYEPVAASKYAGEVAIRARIAELARLQVRVLVVTGDLIEGTITAKLLERRNPGLRIGRTSEGGRATTTEEMGQAIAAAVADQSLPSGYTVVVGGALDSLPPQS